MWNFAKADRATQDRLVRGERESIKFHEEALRRGGLDPRSERNARANISQARETLQKWTGRDR